MPLFTEKSLTSISKYGKIYNRIDTIIYLRRFNAMAKSRSEKDKRYEDKHKEERKAKSIVWGTSVPRVFAEEINDFLKRYGYTKVQLIEEGYKALFDEVASKDVNLGKIVDGYDDFFEFELKKFNEEKNKK